MPPQNQQSPNALPSEDAIRSFMSLDEGGQTAALGKMSPDAKHWLLLGLRALKSVEPTTTPQKEDEGVLKGFVSRIGNTASGLRRMVAPTEEEATEDVKSHLPARIAETYKEGGRQAKQQFKAGTEAIGKGSLVEGGLRLAQSGVTAASLADPFATGSVTDINRMTEEGRLKESIGAGAFDVLTLWMGKKVGEQGIRPSFSTGRQINKLTSAIGETGETVKNLERTLPDIEATVKQTGKPGTIGDFSKVVRKTLDQLQGEFNQVFDPVKNRRAYTPAIKNHIDRVIRENPNLAKTAEGRDQLAALRRIQRQYDKPWTLEDMNLERSRLRKKIRALYDAKPTDAAAKMKLDAELRANKIVADSFSETVNDHLSHITGKPQSYFDILRQKQEALLDLNDHLDTRVEALRDKQAAREGVPLHERIRPHAYASGGGARAHIPFGEAVPGEGVSDKAGRRVREAFGSSRAAKAGRAAILSLPVSHLATAGEEAKKSRMTPPPELEE